MRIRVMEKLAGDVLTTTWVSSGMFPSPITSALIGPGSTVVASQTAVSSGHGFYFSRFQLPPTPGPYINEWRATINFRTYVHRQIVRVVSEAID